MSASVATRLVGRLGQRAAVAASAGARVDSVRSSAVRRQLQHFRPFSADAAGFSPAAAPRPRAGRQKSSGQAASAAKAAAGVCVVGGGVAYMVNDDVAETVNAACSEATDMFEDFNDTSREFFESIGDRIVPKQKEPWLLELATMKYPENIPTLVLDLDKVILHLEHNSTQGWHVIKRPFADQFFKEICHYYEVVLFSDDVFPVALDIATKWNLPVTGVLHRDFCKKRRNHYVKDLSKLGRNLHRVLIIDHDEAAFQLQPENGLLIKPFTGETNDSELADLMDLLKAAATTNGDIRQFVAKFRAQDGLGGDTDIGRRYLVHKQEQDNKVESRRSMGRMFASSTSRTQGANAQLTQLGRMPMR